jgi:predicted O-methyltransferase YrrM
MYAHQISLPQVLDYGQFEPMFQTKPQNHWMWYLSVSAYRLGRSAFNHSPELSSFFHFLSHYHHTNVAIETGTFEGFTTRFFTLNFDEVHTIEISEENYKKGEKLLEDCSNVHRYLGNSPDVLKQILPPLKDQRIFCYLDAHWNEYWPLLDEIKEIGKTHHDNCIIVIDDVKVPGRSDIPFDSYNNQPCSYEYVKNQLQSVFTEYDYHYVIPRNPEMRAKLVTYPKKWKGV